MSDSSVIRFGVIGTGMMGCEHIRNLALLPGVKVTALADPDERSRGWGRKAAGSEAAVYVDHRELLAQADVDAVVIASPNHTHFAVLQDVFRTRKHVLVEKPLCTTVDDCKRIVDQAARHPALTWVGMEYRFMRPVARLVEEVHGGAIGRLAMLAIREHRFPFLPKVGDWNRFARNTGGTLVEKCCHFFDLMNLVTRARPVRVYASGAMDVNHRDERDRGEAAAFIPAHRLVLTRRERNEPTTIAFHVDSRAREAGAHHGSTLLEQLAFRDAIRAGGKPLVSVEDGALAVAVGVAGERSAQERRLVELSELGF